MITGKAVHMTDLLKAFIKAGQGQRLKDSHRENHPFYGWFCFSHL